MLGHTGGGFFDKKMLPPGFIMRTIAKIFTFAFLVLMCAHGHSQKGPFLESKTPVWDFGDVKIGEVKEKTFSMFNGRDKEASIKNVSSCCGYTVVNVSNWEIIPGGESEVTISCDASRKTPGKDEKKVTIRSNDPDNPILQIAVTANIIL